jgi:hypothetical protein
MYYLSFNFAVRPLNFLPVHEYALLSRIRPQNVFSPCNVAPGGRWPARLRPNSGQSAAGVGRARAGGGLWVSLARFFLARAREGLPAAGNTCGPASVAAATASPGEGRLRGGSGYVGKL